MIKKLTTLFHPLKQSASCRYLVIPDLHGTYSIYQQVEHYIKKECEPDRTIIFLGDYLDRGESGEIDSVFYKDAGSYLVLRDLISLKEWAKEQGREMLFLRGNHELFYEAYYFQDDYDIKNRYPFLQHSFDCFDAMFQKEPDFYNAFEKFFQDLLPYYLDRKNRYLFVHAGIDPRQKDLDQQVDDETLYWIRDPFLFSKKKLDYTVVFGHTPFYAPFMKADKIGLDSGVYKRNFFRMLQIDGKDSRIITLHKKSHASV